jgi:hypothetical protein
MRRMEVLQVLQEVLHMLQDLNWGVCVIGEKRELKILILIKIATILRKSRYHVKYEGEVLWVLPLWFHAHNNQPNSARDFGRNVDFY